MNIKKAMKPPGILGKKTNQLNKNVLSILKQKKTTSTPHASLLSLNPPSPAIARDDDDDDDELAAFMEKIDVTVKEQEKVDQESHSRILETINQSSAHEEEILEHPLSFTENKSPEEKEEIVYSVDDYSDVVHDFFTENFETYLNFLTNKRKDPSYYQCKSDRAYLVTKLYTEVFPAQYPRESLKIIKPSSAKNASMSSQKDDDGSPSNLNVPKPIFDWNESALPEETLDLLLLGKTQPSQSSKMPSFPHPTAAQSAVIPALLKGLDLVCVAPTGSGKTLAYTLPLLRHVAGNIVHDIKTSFAQNHHRLLKTRLMRPRGLVISPTRELAIQIYHTTIKYAKTFDSFLEKRVASYISNKKNERLTKLNVGVFYGGVTISQQIAIINAGVDYCITTPGRAIELSSCSSLKNGSGPQAGLFGYTSMVVLDEADRLLDLGFEPQIKQIVGLVHPKKQIAFFSATFPRQIDMVGRQLLRASHRAFLISHKRIHEPVSQLKIPIVSKNQTLSGNLEINTPILFNKPNLVPPASQLPLLGASSGIFNNLGLESLRKYASKYDPNLVRSSQFTIASGNTAPTNSISSATSSVSPDINQLFVVVSPELNKVNLLTYENPKLYALIQVLKHFQEFITTLALNNPKSPLSTTKNLESFLLNNEIPSSAYFSATRQLFDQDLHKPSLASLSESLPPEFSKTANFENKPPLNENYVIKDSQITLSLFNSYQFNQMLAQEKDDVGKITNNHFGSMIIFVEKQDRVDYLLKELLNKGWGSPNNNTIITLHGKMDQFDRESAIARFSSMGRPGSEERALVAPGFFPILITTSISARGLDLEHVLMVVNYDCPSHFEDYVHRCGRTGRAGRSGTAVTFLEKQGFSTLTMISDLICNLPQNYYSESYSRKHLSELAIHYNEKHLHHLSTTKPSHPIKKNTFYFGTEPGPGYSSLNDMSIHDIIELFAGLIHFNNNNHQPHRTIIPCLHELFNQFFQNNISLRQHKTNQKRFLATYRRYFNLVILSNEVSDLYFSLLLFRKAIIDHNNSKMKSEELSILKGSQVFNSILAKMISRFNAIYPELKIDFPEPSSPVYMHSEETMLVGQMFLHDCMSTHLFQPALNSDPDPSQNATLATTNNLALFCDRLAKDYFASLSPKTLAEKMPRIKDQLLFFRKVSKKLKKQIFSKTFSQQLTSLKRSEESVLDDDAPSAAITEDGQTNSDPSVPSESSVKDSKRRKTAVSDLLSNVTGFSGSGFKFNAGERITVREKQRRLQREIAGVDFSDDEQEVDQNVIGSANAHHLLASNALGSSAPLAISNKASTAQGSDDVSPDTSSAAGKYVDDIDAYIEKMFSGDFDAPINNTQQAPKKMLAITQKAVSFSTEAADPHPKIQPLKPHEQGALPLTGSDVSKEDAQRRIMEGRERALLLASALKTSQPSKPIIPPGPAAPQSAAVQEAVAKISKILPNLAHGPSMGAKPAASPATQIVQPTLNVNNNEAPVRSVPISQVLSSLRPNTVFEFKDLNGDHFVCELIINDFPQTARWNITNKDFLSNMLEENKVAVTVRGSFQDPKATYSSKGSKPPDRKLYLVLEANSSRNMEIAKMEIKRVIKEELNKIQNYHEYKGYGGQKSLGPAYGSSDFIKFAIKY